MVYEALRLLRDPLPCFPALTFSAIARMTTSEAYYHSEKFESLQLSPMWDEAVGHVDHQLSHPEYVSPILCPCV